MAARDNTSKAISFDSTKEAALYFERVLPFDTVSAAFGENLPQHGFSSGGCLPYSDVELAVQVMRSLSPHIGDAGSAVRDLIGIQLALFHVRHKISSLNKNEMESLSEIVNHFNNEYNAGLTIDKYFSDKNAFDDLVKAKSAKALTNFGYGKCAVWTNADEDEEVGIGVPFFETTISGLKLVDASRLTWEEIIEFRRDKTSWKTLRDLRLFFSENYSGKDQGYISDKLLQLVDRQEEAAKIWKFETAQKSLSVAFNSQSALVTSATGLAAAYGGASLSAAAAASLIFPIGSAALEFGKVLIDSAKARVDRPTRFLTKIKQLGRN